MLKAVREKLGDGNFWMKFWIVCFFCITIWGVLTIVLWMESVPNLNMLSIVALLLGCGSSFQASLGMRKSDPKDPL